METNHQRYFGSPEKVARMLIDNTEGTEEIIVWQHPEDGGAWVDVAEFSRREDFYEWLKSEA